MTAINLLWTGFAGWSEAPLFTLNSANQSLPEHNAHLKF